MADNKYYYANGKRKSAIARVRLIENGSGKVTVNDKDIKEYFSGVYIGNILSPLKVTDTLKGYDVTIVVTGGGYSAQSDACRHGISKALIELDPGYRTALKPEGFLTRDPRKKERKKPGLRRARRAPQWAKR